MEGFVGDQAMLSVDLQSTRAQALLLVLEGNHALVVLNSVRNVRIVRDFTFLH